jgi:hypothetical protein
MMQEIVGSKWCRMASQNSTSVGKGQKACCRIQFSRTAPLAANARGQTWKNMAEWRARHLFPDTWVDYPLYQVLEDFEASLEEDPGTPGPRW